MARKAFALAALFGCLSLAIGLTDYPDPAKGRNDLTRGKESVWLTYFY